MNTEQRNNLKRIQEQLTDCNAVIRQYAEKEYDLNIKKREIVGEIFLSDVVPSLTERYDIIVGDYRSDILLGILSETTNSTLKEFVEIWAPWSHDHIEFPDNISFNVDDGTLSLSFPDISSLLVFIKKYGIKVNITNYSEKLEKLREELRGLEKIISLVPKDVT